MIKLPTKRILGALAALAIGTATVCFAEGYFKLQQTANAVAAPQLLSVSNTTYVTVFTNNLSVTDGRVLLRSLQNTGTNPVLYAINTTNVSVTNYHGIIAGGKANLDGTGGILDLSRVPWPVSLTAVSGTSQVSVIELTQ
jgi:hypothetical protein